MSYDHAMSYAHSMSYAHAMSYAYRMINDHVMTALFIQFNVIMSLSHRSEQGGSLFPWVWQKKISLFFWQNKTELAKHQPEG